MIPLSAQGDPHGLSRPIIGRIATTRAESWPPRTIWAMSEWERQEIGRGPDALLCGTLLGGHDLAGLTTPTVHSVKVDHLSDGDIVRLDERGHVRTLYRRHSNHNTLFATERCNSLCLMCSQPPRDVNDDWRIQEMLDVVSLMDPATKALGITGGEPSLLGDGLLRVVRTCRDALPTTALHILSNGRLFRYWSLAKAFGELHHPDVMIGVPVYSDIDHEHDHVVQAKGAFDDTLLGLQNLARAQVPVEIRVVIHRSTYKRLPQLAEFIYRNLTFAAQVALMGLEIAGYTIGNLEDLWIDPWEYRSELELATMSLADRGMNVLVYNHQLCTVPERIWPFCRKSISDWKNEYIQECERCAVQEMCGGFFASSARRRSAHIHAVSPAPLQ
jgi:His-Xaa-Ser system radical SAM maturase HxsC